ncbi:MAG: rhombosortase [Planctomycetes bacterium]|nr:rhombosortase [Planctomycetota bacterium]
MRPPDVTTSSPISRLPWLTVLFLLPLGLVAAEPSLGIFLEYDRLKLLQGDLWRLITCHWIHYSGDHLLWDTFAFVLLGLLCEGLGRARVFLCVTTSAILIPLAVYACMPPLRYYAGLSGIDSALFGLLCMTMIRQAVRHRDRLLLGAALLAAALFLGKVAFEASMGETWFVDSTAARIVPVPLAHGIGVLVGVLFAFDGPLALKAGLARIGRRAAGRAPGTAGSSVEGSPRKLTDSVPGPSLRPVPAGSRAHSPGRSVLTRAGAASLAVTGVLCATGCLGYVLPVPMAPLAVPVLVAHEACRERHFASEPGEHEWRMAEDLETGRWRRGRRVALRHARSLEGKLEAGPGDAVDDPGSSRWSRPPKEAP